MNTRKMIKSICCVFTLLLGATNAYAEDVVDTTKTGSITITLDNNQVSGGSLRLYQVATIEDNAYVLTNGFEDADVSLTTLNDTTASTLALYTGDSTYTTKSITKGQSTVFNNVPVGLYLVVQDGSFDGYEGIDPFLVSIPLKEDGSYVYDVNASPKVGTLTKTSPKPTPPTPTIPKTGQLNWPIPVLAFGGILFILIGWNVLKKDEA